VQKSSFFQFTIKHIKIKIYRTPILPVVLYGCETWLLTLTEEHRRRVFENRVLRRIFGPKRDEVTGKRRRLHNEVFIDLCSSPNTIQVIKSRRMRWAGHVACMGDRKPAHRVLSGNLRERGHQEDPSMGGKIILKWIFKKWNSGA
jgi:hypothetical protein